MNEIQLYFSFDSEVIVDQWIRNMTKCYMSLPYSFNLKEVFLDNMFENNDNSLVIPMDLICSK